jgi:hypothetical protein
MTLDLPLRPLMTAAEPLRPAPRAAGMARADGAAPPPAAPATPNPRLRLDSSLGMVVIEFRDTAGEVANTIPSQRAIAAYRAAAVSDAPVPVGVRPPPGAEAPAGPPAEARPAPPAPPTPGTPAPARPRADAAG